MATSDHRDQPGFIGWLAGVVIVVGFGSWLVTSRIGSHGASPTPSHPPAVTASPTPPNCGSHELNVVGGFDECATAAPDAATICTLSSQGLAVLLRFSGSTQTFELNIEIDGFFAGAGKYDLPPWPHGMGVRDGVPKVEVEEYSTETIWQSVAGVLTITGSDGHSGTLSATLQATTGTSAVPGVPAPTLSIDGQWTCP